MTLRRYYPLPASASGGGGGDLAITNMYATTPLASQDPIQYATGNPLGGISKKFTALVVGGTPPYTYSWTLISGAITCTNTAIADPYFNGSNPGTNPTTVHGLWELTVTDAASDSVSAFNAYVYYFGLPIP